MHPERTDPEPRRFPRAPFAGLVEIFGRGRRRARMAAREIGGGGVSLHTNAPLPPGRFVTLRLGPDGGPPFTVVGRVVWATAGATPVMGVRFVDIAAGDRARIVAFVGGRR